MGAQLKSNTHLLNTFFDFLSRFLRVWLQSSKKVFFFNAVFQNTVTVTIFTEVTHDVYSKKVLIHIT
jgi:hypothetical protein